MTQQLPPYPDHNEFVEIGATAADYREAIIAFYESRLRVAVEALKSIGQVELCNLTTTVELHNEARKALALIGTLPEKETT